MTDILWFVFAWVLGLITGLVIRVGRERSSFNLGLATGRRQSRRNDAEKDEEWRRLFR